MDKYTKFILTIIAILLAGNMFVIHNGFENLSYEVGEVASWVSNVNASVSDVRTSIDDLE